MVCVKKFLLFGSAGTAFGLTGRVLEDDRAAVSTSMQEMLARDLSKLPCQIFTELVHYREGEGDDVPRYVGYNKIIYNICFKSDTMSTQEYANGNATGHRLKADQTNEKMHIGTFKDTYTTDDGSVHARFTDGSNKKFCTYNRHRTLDVKFFCGKEKKVEKLYEDDHCVYKAIMTHPYACGPCKEFTFPDNQHVDVTYGNDHHYNGTDATATCKHDGNMKVRTECILGHWEKWESGHDFNCPGKPCSNVDGMENGITADGNTTTIRCKNNNKVSYSLKCVNGTWPNAESFNSYCDVKSKLKTARENARIANEELENKLKKANNNTKHANNTIANLQRQLRDANKELNKTIDAKQTKQASASVAGAGTAFFNINHMVLYVGIGLCVVGVFVMIVLCAIPKSSTPQGNTLPPNAKETTKDNEEVASNYTKEDESVSAIQV